MPRNLPAGVAAASQAEVIRPRFLVELDFGSGIIRVTDAPFSIFWDSDGDMVDEEFFGVGDMGSISAVEETIEGKAKRVTLRLTGVKSSLISAALNENYRLRPGRIWRTYLNEDNQIKGAPHPRFIGLMDTMVPRLDGADSTILLNIVNRYARWETALDAPRWSDEDHQFRRPGDTFLSRMPEIAKGKEVFWGKG